MGQDRRDKLKITLIDAHANERAAVRPFQAELAVELRSKGHDVQEIHSEHIREMASVSKDSPSNIFWLSFLDYYLRLKLAASIIKKGRMVVEMHAGAFPNKPYFFNENMWRGKDSALFHIEGSGMLGAIGLEGTLTDSLDYDFVMARFPPERHADFAHLIDPDVRLLRRRIKESGAGFAGKFLQIEIPGEQLFSPLPEFATTRRDKEGLSKFENEYFNEQIVPLSCRPLRGDDVVLAANWAVSTLRVENPGCDE